MVVPLLTAGGMRVKIIESMAIGRPVISTRIGAEGIDCRKEVHYLAANSPEEFAEAIHKVYTHKELTAQMGKEARKLVEDKYDNKLLTRDLLNFYQSLLPA
jgi:glycosyltransferase involved in cell wall biosynthesis